MKNWIEAAFEALRTEGVEIGPALSRNELEEVEAELHLTFPDDLKALLAAGLPQGPGFPDWRSPRSEQILEWLDEPSAGVEFDVEENGIWLPSWGERPADIDHAIDEAHRLVHTAPQLIPLYRHHYLPAQPATGGGPVLSIEATDVAVIAANLPWWFHHQWGAPAPDAAEPEPLEVPFWSELLT